MSELSLPPATSMWLNIAVAVLGALTTGSATMTDLFGQGPAQKIMGGIGLASMVVGAVNGALHGYSPPVAGPAVK